MITKIKSFIKNLYFIFLLLTVFACSNEKNNDTLVVGTSADNPPYEYLDKNNKIVGIDIAIINHIAKALGKNVEIKNMDFQGLIPALKAGNIDLIIAGVSKTDLREKELDFSISYYTSNMAVIVNNHINNVENLSQKIIGVQSYTTWEKFAYDLKAKDNSISIKSVPNNLVLISELKLKNIDMIIMEVLQAKLIKAEHPQFNYFILPSTSSEFSIVLNKNSKLKEKINEIIVSMQKQDIIKGIEEKYTQKLN